MGHGSNEQSETGASAEALDPDEIGDHRFPVVFRGYDRRAVGLYLQRVANAHRAALDALAEASLVAAELDAAAVPEPADVDPAPDAGLVTDAGAADEADPISLFDDDLAAVVRQTRERVIAIEDTARRRADATLVAAELDAARIEDAAQARADELLATGSRLATRLVEAKAELSRVLDELGVDDDHGLIDLSDRTLGAERDHDGGPAPIDPPPGGHGQTGVATLADPRVTDPITRAEPAAEDEPLEGEDDEAYDRMVRDALDRAMRSERDPNWSD